MTVYFGLTLAGAVISLLSGPFDTQKLAAWGQWLGGFATVLAISFAYYHIAEQRQHDTVIARERQQGEELTNWLSLRAEIRCFEGATIAGSTKAYGEADAVRIDTTVRHLGTVPLIDIRITYSFEEPVLVEPASWSPGEELLLYQVSLEEEPKESGIELSADTLQMRFGDVAHGEIKRISFVVGGPYRNTARFAISAIDVFGNVLNRSVTADRASAIDV